MMMMTTALNVCSVLALKVAFCCFSCCLMRLFVYKPLCLSTVCLLVYLSVFVYVDRLVVIYHFGVSTVIGLL